MIPGDIKEISSEVYVATSAIVTLGVEHIAFLKHRALSTVRGRARICAHRASEDLLHEMLIAVSASSYVRPHRHVGKSESFHIVEGVVDVVIFDDAGNIIDLIELGDSKSSRAFYYRLAQSSFHTLIIHTPMLVMHEITNGPFVRDETIVATFAPPEEQTSEAARYLAQVRTVADDFRAGRRRNAGAD